MVVGGQVLAGPGAEPVREARRINGVLTAVRGFVAQAVTSGQAPGELMGLIYELADERDLPAQARGEERRMAWRMRAQHRLHEPEATVDRASDEEIVAQLRACRFRLASRVREAIRKIRKAVGLLKRPRFAQAMLIHRVAAATEHSSAIRVCEPNTLLDAGANKGQFSLAFRALRPGARIVAFEPLPGAADTFERMFSGDELTRVQRVALAGTKGSAEFHVADRADSSSLLKLGKDQERAFGVRCASIMKVPVKRLDASVDIQALPHPIFLKVDVLLEVGEILDGVNLHAEPGHRGPAARSRR